MAINIHKSKENIDIEEALGVIWTSLQRNEDDFEKVSETIEKGVSQNITNILLEKNFIIKEKNKIKLTASGEDLGKQLTRRHRLTERLLADVLDFNRQDIEKIACDLEHNLSTDLADSICTLLGHPKQCPHGNPIPEGNCCKNSSSKIESIVVPLSKIDIAEEVTLLKEKMSDTKTTTVAGMEFCEGNLDGKDVIVVHGVRYYDKYVKKNGKWRISEREQYFVFSDTRELKNEN